MARSNDARSEAVQQLDHLLGPTGLIATARHEGLHPLRGTNGTGPVAGSRQPAAPQPGDWQLVRAADEASQRLAEALGKLAPHARPPAHGDVQRTGRLLQLLLRDYPHPEAQLQAACQRVHTAYTRLHRLARPHPGGQPAGCDTPGCARPRQDGRRCYRCRRHRERHGAFPHLAVQP